MNDATERRIQQILNRAEEHIGSNSKLSRYAARALVAHWVNWWVDRFGENAIDDFCIQCIDHCGREEDVVVLGGWRRVQWHYSTGFTILVKHDWE